jgi:hypothetical protein
MIERSPHVYLEKAVTDAGFDYTSAFVEVAYQHPNGRVLFQVLNGTSVDGIKNSTISDERKDQYKALYFHDLINFYRRWISAQPENLGLAEVLQERIDQLRNSLEELCEVVPLSEHDLNSDFADIVSSILIPCPVELKGGEK